MYKRGIVAKRSLDVVPLLRHHSDYKFDYPIRVVLIGALGWYCDGRWSQPRYAISTDAIVSGTSAVMTLWHHKLAITTVFF